MVRAGRDVRKLCLSGSEEEHGLAWFPVGSQLSGSLKGPAESAGGKWPIRVQHWHQGTVNLKAFFGLCLLTPDWFWRGPGLLPLASISLKLIVGKIVGFLFSEWSVEALLTWMVSVCIKNMLWKSTIYLCLFPCLLLTRTKVLSSLLYLIKPHLFFKHQLKAYLPPILALLVLSFPELLQHSSWILYN